MFQTWDQRHPKYQLEKVSKTIFPDFVPSSCELFLLWWPSSSWPRIGFQTSKPAYSLWSWCPCWSNQTHCSSNDPRIVHNVRIRQPSSQLIIKIKITTEWVSSIISSVCFDSQSGYIALFLFFNLHGLNGGEVSLPKFKVNCFMCSIEDWEVSQLS